MTASARTAAFDALRAVARQRADLPSALADSRRRLSDSRDRALAGEIVTGTLRWQRSLDFLITHFAQRPLHRVDPAVAVILRLSLYQLLHLDRVPAAAVVDDAVNLARGARKASAAGFVNAVLRAALRQRQRLPLPPRPGAGADRSAILAYLGLTHSHPEWLVGRWLDRYGFDAAERWVQFNNETPRLTLRANTLCARRQEVAAALAAAGVETAVTQYAPDGLIVTAGNPLGSPTEGLFFVQDEASQLVTLAVGAHDDARVLDLCASPGGKTTAMAADMHDTGLLVASDVKPRRLPLLQNTIRASGATRVHIVRVAVSGSLPFLPAFDRVLVDAPCSGLGTLRRDPDIRWRRAEADLLRFAHDQLLLLHRAADVVRSGGRLVYATCSSEPEENEQVVDAFLRTRDEFALTDLRAERPTALQPFLDTRGMMHTLPFRDGLEAFFAAALQRH